MIKSSIDLNTKINQEVTKSFRNVNYSQWERQSTKQPSQINIKKNVEQASSSSLGRVHRPTSTKAQDLQQATTSKSSDSQERSKTSFQNPRPGHKIQFKSRKQQLEEEARRKLLKTKIKYTKQNILVLQDRVSELTEVNLDIIEYIEKTEKKANDIVDGILRKYERYQDVMTTVEKKHGEEIDSHKSQLNFIKKESKMELPKYTRVSDNIERELQDAQDLNKQLSIYKNQEYPEKILQINNLRKNLEDIKAFQNAEKEAFLRMIESDRDRELERETKFTENIASKVATRVVDEMHFSLKEMAMDNESMKSEIEFFLDLREKLKDEEDLLEKECIILKSDKRRNQKAVIFDDVFLEKTICTPDMDIVLDLPQKELY